MCAWASECVYWGRVFIGKIPLVDRVYLQSIRRRLVTMPIQTLTTTDGVTVTVGAGFGYRITDLLQLYRTLHHAEGTLQNMAMGAIATYVHDHARSEVTPEHVMQAASAALDLKQYGLSDPEVVLTTFAAITAYRLVMDSSWSAPGDNLNTNLALGAPPTP